MNDKQIIKERIKYSDPMLHFEQCDSKRRRREFHEVPWHWHVDFELSFIKSGKVVYRTFSKEIILHPGDVVFINSKVIHSVAPFEPCEDVHHYSHFFDNYFISGSEGNTIDTKYVIPLQNNSDIDIIVFRSENERYAKLHQLIDNNIALITNREKYYEFKLRQNICDIWQIIVDSVDVVKEDIGVSDLSNKRLRKAITYIQKHYMERITLENISEHVHVSIRECNRMFNKYLKVSPINYLQEVRLQKATAMLTDTDKSIADIALENGYTGSSHFGKKFKERHHITPSQYRDNLKK